MVFEMSTSENLGGFNYSAPSGSANSLLRSYWSDIKVELKLKVDVQFAGSNTDGNPNKFTYIFTYEIGESHIILKNTELYPSLANSIADIYQYEEDLDFSNLVFNGTPIEGCELNGTTYTCQAWNDITINGNLSTSNGYTVNLIAGNQIETFPESVISPEINLAIVLVLNYSQPMPEATSTYVSNFCNKLLADSLDYQANTVPINKILLDTVQEIQNSISNSLNLTNAELDFQLFPNPSSQLTTVIVEGNESGLATLSVFDVMGKEQNLIIQGQNGQFDFDVSTLDKGMYFVRVKSIGASKTKQLIVK